jgi:NADP-dependent 3-hydroxy acid dehydrogenase YdfG
MDLQGRVAIVTGASRGLGMSFTEALIAKGARVAGFARSADLLAEAARRHGDSFLPVPCDVGDLPQVRAAVRKVVESTGRIDVVINNAGIGRFGPIDALPKEDWDEMVRTNLTGVYHVTREVVPVLKAGGGGHIVNIASIAGLLGNPNLSGYNATKFGVRGLSEALFKELRESGIKVTAVFPGSVETSFAHSSAVAAHKMAAAEVAEVVLFALERSDNFLISEVVMRPLRPH